MILIYYCFKYLLFGITATFTKMMILKDYFLKKAELVFWEGQLLTS